MTKRQREMIVVRSLKESDLGIFAAHRSSATSKQRAININADIAAKLLSASLFRAKGTSLECFCTFRDAENISRRDLSKVHKNWRLGGNKLEGKEFAIIDSLDFALIRSMEANSGSYPISMTFIARGTRPVMHSRIAALVASRLKQSMAVYTESEQEFRFLASLCPIAPTGAEIDTSELD
ncbi:MAG: hypothetical protein AB7H70_11585 [Rhodospirillaceae bacterium]